MLMPNTTIISIIVLFVAYSVRVFSYITHYLFSVIFLFLLLLPLHDFLSIFFNMSETFLDSLWSHGKPFGVTLVIITCFMTFMLSSYLCSHIIVIILFLIFSFAVGYYPCLLVELLLLSLSLLSSLPIFLLLSV